MSDTSIASATSALAALLDRHTPCDGVHATAIPRLHLIRSTSPTDRLPALHQPAMCIVAQGRKRVMLGNSVFTYDRADYLVVSVEVPVIGQILEASVEAPYLCLRLDLDPVAIGALLLEVDFAHAEPAPVDRPLSLSSITSELLGSALRLLGLLDKPQDIAILAPMVEREILYRLLTGDQSATLRQIAVADSKLHQVNRAIGWIKQNFRAPFSIDVLASEARMSHSTLHEHFKSITSMSPLQYQKQLRLQEARRLILSQSLDSAMAGHLVGYDSPSQFSREYKRAFGASPTRDIARLRALPAWQRAL